ncbi:MAG: hypothetical protein M3Z06_14130 [Actinomycetota bacterium]|nr:hypothetical protein [Actinomycetota bacterium]
MSATSAPSGRGLDQGNDGRTGPADRSEVGRRLSTETKSAFKTTEFVAYVAVLAGILIAGAITKASGYAGNHDPFRADRVWLYVTVVTVGYMVSRGIAKAGSRQPYDESA